MSKPLKFRRLNPQSSGRAPWTTICVVAAGIVGASLLSACSESSQPQQTVAKGGQDQSSAAKGQSQAAKDQQARKDADENAWAEASRAGTSEAINAYLKTH